MIGPFRKKTVATRIGEAFGRRPRHPGTAVRSGLVALGTAAGVVAASAAASAIRERRQEGDQGDQA
ncbi:hypothetical protein [Isoptericola dokdonensis]|uniref:Uncharacterized protein n=1 Tax=Isoptericola dokdonensis DS-3 TaxID=1300344 RepID=A0A161IIY3_9MICO|nr:hypothetical protein [Isoptericola dokdonensis]ANC31924.1 hypothetical protein I598_2384 [Isoptericola dokdonensis DS-3]